PLTPEQRAAALEKAAAARRARAEVKNRLKYSQGSLGEVIQEGQNSDVIGKMKVSALLEALPGVGKIRAKQIMDEIGISESRRVRESMPEAFFVFLAPPSFEELERRLVGRGTETAEERERRLFTARQELAAEKEFDFTIVNDDVSRATEELVHCMGLPTERIS